MGKVFDLRSIHIESILPTWGENVFIV